MGGTSDAFDHVNESVNSIGVMHRLSKIISSDILNEGRVGIYSQSVRVC